MSTRAVVFPDSEWIVTDYLTSRPDVTAPVATNLIGWTEGQRRIVVTRIGGVPEIPYRLDHPRLDIDCYAESKTAAHDLAQIARVAIHDLPDVDYSSMGAVVSHVADETGFQWLPEQISNAARYIFTVALSVHPYP